MTTEKQLKLHLAQKKEKASKLIAVVKVLKDEIKQIADQLKVFKEEEPTGKKKPVGSRKKK
jgi:hypothetical protein